MEKNETEKLKLRIGDKYFDVILVPDRARDQGTNESAASSEWYQKIYLSINDRKWDGIMSDLWHEIMEQINRVYGFGFNHQTITILGVSVYQVLRDNQEVLLEISKKGRR